MSLGPGELLALAMLGTLAIVLFSGVPVAVVLIGVGLGFGALGVAMDLLRTEQLGAIFFRLYGTLTDTDDLAYAAVPLLIMMGAVMHEAGLARNLLEGLRSLMPATRAAPAITVIVVGIVLAPMAGVVGAAVSALTMLALPAMLERGYRPDRAAGVAAGTLGVVLPPSVMLFFVADALGVQVPALYLGMLGPVTLLIACVPWCQ